MYFGVLTLYVFLMTTFALGLEKEKNENNLIMHI